MALITYLHHAMIGIIGCMPVRFRWTIHNIVAHPMHEVLHLCGMDAAATAIHDATIPIHDPDKAIE